MKRLVALLALAALTTPACADHEADGTGTFVLGLRDSVGGFFRLRVMSEAPDQAISGRALFDTGCLEAKSRTYELAHIPSGADRWVVLESFADADCASRVEVGYRGGVTIPNGSAAPYYHVPLYEHGTTTPLPEGINISAATAQRVNFCQSDADCADFGPPAHVCFDGQMPEYYCVPRCTKNADCTEMHPNAICQASTSWCMLHSPYPLNLSEPRTMGYGVTASSGEPMFVGGFGRISTGKLYPGNTQVEMFDVQQGLFAKVEITGAEVWGAGLAAYANLGNDTLVAVGGLRSLSLRWNEDGGDFQLDLGDLAEADCSGPSCVPNIVQTAVAFDLSARTAVISELPGVPIAMSTVIPLDGTRFLVAGGVTPTQTGTGAEPTAQTLICQVDASLSTTCTATGDMVTPRAMAAGTCVTPACEQVLILGGAPVGPAAELGTIAGSDVTFELVSSTLPGRLFAPSLCGLRLIAGADHPDGVGGQGPLELELVGTALGLTPLSSDVVTELPIWPAVTELGSGDCWAAGGIDGAGHNASTVYRVTGSAISPDTHSLARARFGAMATSIGSGPLSGAIMFAGGVALTGTADGGAVDVVRGAEVLLP